MQDVFLQVQDASKLEKAAEEVIPESGEEGILICSYA